MIPAEYGKDMQLIYVPTPPQKKIYEVEMIQILTQLQKADIWHAFSNSCLVTKLEMTIFVELISSVKRKALPSSHPCRA